MDDPHNDFNPLLFLLLWPTKDYGKGMRDVAIGFALGILMGVAIIAISIW